MIGDAIDTIPKGTSRHHSRRSSIHVATINDG